MHFTRMEEITPIKAPGKDALPTGAIIKEAWKISTTYFWPLTMAIFLIQIPERILLGLGNERQAWQISAWYEMLVSGFVFIGTYRCIIGLKLAGVVPTFSNVYAEGQAYFGRNFRYTWLIHFYSFFIILGAVIIVLPCLFLLRDSRNEPWSYILLFVTLIPALLIIGWWAIRIFISRAALSDNASGANKAFEEAMSLTKGKAFKLAPVLLCIIGAYLIWFVFHIMVYIGIAGGMEADVTKTTEIKINLASALPYAFVEVFGIAVAALTYLHLKEASLPPISANETPTSVTPPA